jgi:hypothetical protein
LKPDQLQALNTKIADIGGDHLQAKDAPILKYLLG